MAAVYTVITQKRQLPETMTQKQERFMRMERNIALGKNGGYMFRSLGGRSFSVSRQAVSE